MSDLIRAIAFGCRHAPLTDARAATWVLGEIRAFKPDVLIDLGDGIEGNAASQWDDAKELDIDLKDELDADEAFMKAAREAAGAKTKLVRLAGNHESNLQRKGRIDKRLRSLCGWNQRKEFENWHTVTDYLYCRRRGCYWLTPQVCLSHGYETTAGRILREATYFLANSPSSLYVHAHTHRPHEVKPVVWGDLPLGRWVANVGCLRNLKPDYMERKPTWNWGHALVKIEAMQLKSPRMSREWSAHTEVFQMFDEAA